MKKSINLILGISFIIFVALIIWINYLMKNNIGDIEYNAKLDDATFNVCNEDRIFQYYSVGTTYIGERKAIRESVFSKLKNETLFLNKESGYITFRFIVNCEGEAGRYRVKMVDENMKETFFENSTIAKLESSIKSLKNWRPGLTKNGNSVDSYYQINFKLENGNIKDIF